MKVIGSRTVRERDGLAMSSRNVYLSPQERSAAPVLFRAMKESARRLRAGDPVEAAMAGGAEMISGCRVCAGLFRGSACRNARADHVGERGPLRILVAAKIGTTRLIDNMAV